MVKVVDEDDDDDGGGIWPARFSGCWEVMADSTTVCEVNSSRDVW